MNLNELSDLQICKKCNIIYMPQFKKSTYETEQYPINLSCCERCEPLNEEN